MGEFAGDEVEFALDENGAPQEMRIDGEIGVIEPTAYRSNQIIFRWDTDRF